MTVVAEAVVKVRADTSTFKQEAESGARRGLTGLQADAIRTEAAFKKMTTQGQIAIVNRKELALTTAQVTKVTVDFLQAQRALLAAEFNAVVGIDAETAALRFQEIQAIDTKLALAGVNREAQRAGGRGGGFFGKLGGRESGGALSLLGRGGLQFAAAIAAFQAFQRLTKALEATGDEAFTTEGRLRNVGASILKLDIVGAYEAIEKKAPIKAFEELKDVAPIKTFDDLKKAIEGGVVPAERASVALRAYGRESLLAADKADKLTRVNFANVGKLSDDLREQAVEALALARALDVATTAVYEVDRAMAQAGSEAAAFGERTSAFGRGVGAVAAQAGATTGGTSTVDPNDTAAGNKAIRDARARTLRDQLANARTDLREAEQRQKNERGIIERRKANILAVAQAQREVDQIQEAIAKEAADAAAKADSDAKAAKAERDRLAQQERDRIAKEKADALAAYKGRQELALLKIRNAQAVADLDGKVTARDIALKKKEIAALGKLAADRKRYTDLEREQFRSDQIKARADLKALKEGKAGGGDGATPEDFFAAAVANFRSFGGGTSGILSGQDARGSLAGRVLGQRPTATVGRGLIAGGSRVAPTDPIADAAAENTKQLGNAAAQQLNESRKQTRYLQIIAKQTTRLGKAAVVAGAATDTRSRN